MGEDRDAPDPAMKTTMAGDRETPERAMGTAIKGPSEPSPERRIGAYRVLRELGHGGMGTVFLAARADDQYQKQVAIKVVRGLDSDQIVRYFRRERQILAALDHPNIARLLDGGATEDGLPYFVMECVEGEPIDSFCDQRKLSVQERLRLFQGVCAAVQYAHQNLVVHRDLKPKNILVDAQGVPKLLDFGIAKLLSAEISGETATGTALAMTPEYASPEQMRGQPITTATDVYALGVVLYELLTGHRPYGWQVRDSLELLKAVCEEEPERPSTAVGRTEQRMLPDGAVHTTTPESASRTREGTPEKLRRRLRGDLDNIILMALRKEPQRRYRSVEAFSEDIRQYLEGRPVTAHKATAWYRTGKFVRRHALGVGAAVAVFLFAVGFGVVTTVQSHRIARERDKPERLATFMVDLFKVSDPNKARGNSITAREVLDKGAEKISKELKDEPETRAMLMDTMGKVYLGLGLYDPAKSLLEEAVRIRRQLFGNQHPDVAASLDDLAGLLFYKGDYVHAESLAREALAMRRKLFGNQHPDVAASLRGVANLLYIERDYAGAEALYRETLSTQRKLFGNEHLSVALTLSNLGGVLYAKGDYAGAEPLFREALAMRRKLLGNDTLDVAASLQNLAALLQVKRDYAAAESLYREALSTYRKISGNEHPQTAVILNNLGLLLSRQGNYAAAEPLYREAIAMRRKLLGDKHPDVAGSVHNLADMFMMTKDYAAAEPLYREALAIRRKSLGNERPEVADCLAGLAWVLVVTGRASEGEQFARAAVEIRRKKLPADSPDTVRSEGVLGICLVKLHRFDEAEPLLLKSYDFLSTKEPKQQVTRMTLEHIITLYEAWGKPDKAAEWRKKQANTTAKKAS